LQGGDPPLGALLERRDLVGRQAQAGHVVEVGRRLRRGEAKIGGADLGQLGAGAQAGQWEPGVGSGADDQSQLRRQMVDQEAHTGAQGGAVGSVIVVQHHGHRAR